jgi:opine dehydrogenase
LAGVKTPVIDSLITLASAISRTDYRSEGLTLGKMGLTGIRAEDLPMVLREGF